MNRVNFFILAFFFPFSTLYSQTVKEILSSQYGIKGNIKTFTESYYFFNKNDSLTEEKQLIYGRRLEGPIKKGVYDSARNQFIVTFYTQEPDSIIRTFTHFFDKYGNRIKYIDYGKDTQVVRTAIKYSINQQPIEKSTILERRGKKDTTTYVEMFSYDKAKNIIEKKDFYKERVLANRLTYTYNKVGKLTSDSWYVGSGGFYSMIPCGDNKQHWYVPDTGFFIRHIYEYNRQNKETLKLELNANKCVVRQIITTYDSVGNRVQEKSLDENNQQFNLWTGKYDTKGNLIEEVIYTPSYKNGTKITYQHDSVGNVVYVESIDARNRVEWSTTIAYDGHRNWIKKIEKFKGKLSTLLEREITY